MSKLSLIIFCMLAISSSVIYAQKDGRYRPVTTAATKKPLFPVLGRYNANQNDGKYKRSNENGQYRANDQGKYSKTNQRNNKPTKSVKAAVANKPKIVTHSSNVGKRGATLRRNFVRARPTRAPAPLPSLPAGRGTSIGRNDFKILSLINEPEIDGYRFAYETENGISADEEGHIVELPTGEGLQTRGSFEYTGDDGLLYHVDYVADDAGFVPTGAHIHPTPPHVIKLLEYLALNAKK